MIRVLRWMVASICVLILSSGAANAQASKDRRANIEKNKREREQKKKDARDKKASEKKEKKEKKDTSDTGPADTSGPREAVKSFRRTKKAADEEMPAEEKKEGDAGPTEAKPPKKVGDGSLIPGEPNEIERLLSDPRTTEEMWRVLDRDTRFGLKKEAKRHLAQLLAQPDLAEKVVELREKHGSAMLVALSVDPELRALSKPLVDLSNQQAQKKARDSDRIKHFIGNLSKSPAERGYAVQQLRHAGAHAVPHFVAALSDRNADRMALIDGLLNLDASAAPAAAALLESRNPATVDLGIELLDNYGSKDSAASLWYVAASPNTPQPLRRHAQEVLARLLKIDSGKLPSSPSMLAEEAEKYYQHKADLGSATSNVEIWKLVNEIPTPQAVSVSEAEEFYGQRYAKQAIELDPNNVPARVALLSVFFDKSYQKAGMEKPLPDSKHGAVETSLGVGADLIAQVLNKALDEGRTPVVLGAVKALGATGRLNALASTPEKPSPFARALNYPSRRVQFAAATSVLEMHPTEYFPFANRVIQTLTRAADMDSKLKALVVAGNTISGRDKASVLTSSGYGAELAQGGRNGFDLAAQSAAFDLAIIDAEIQEWPLEQTIANFRSDARTAGLPIVVLYKPQDEARARTMQAKYPRVIAMPAGITPENFAKAIKAGLVDAGDKPLSPAEKQQQQTIAVEWLQRLARGEFSFIDVRPAASALAKLLSNPQLGPAAAAALAKMPSAEIQSKLAGILLSSTQDMPNRVAAGLALAQNIQSSSPGIDRATIAKLVDSLWKADDKNLRIALARVVGAIGPTDNDVAKLVLQYRSLTPDDLRPAAPAPAPEKESDDADADKKLKSKKQLDEAEKPAPKKAEEKKPAKKSKSFFDDN